MFEIPQAKRVRRSDLFNASRSISPVDSAHPLENIDPEIELKLRQRLASIYGSIEVNNGVYQVTAKKQLEDEIMKETMSDAEEEHEAFEFRLFSTKKIETNEVEKDMPVQKILLAEEEVVGEGGFVRTRDVSFYIQEKATGDRKRDIESVAVSGETILRGMEKRYFGWEVPWRVTVIRDSVNKSQVSLRGQDIYELVERKKKKPGKKRRILLRVRMKKKAEMQKKRKEEMEAKEAALREKKTRRNREKKVKRKLKEKAKKTSSAGNPGEGSAGVDASEGDPLHRETSTE